MKKALSVFNPAEWVIVIASSSIFIAAAHSLQSPFVPMIPTAFWSAIAANRQQKANGSNTVSDFPQGSLFTTEYEEKYRRLLNMVGGDKQTCDSLISSFGVDKAIEDLIRDRR